MKKVEIKVRIANQLTGEVVTDSHIQTSYEDRKSFGAACERNHKVFSQDNADCCVNMSWRYEGDDTWCFIYGVPINQQRDELAADEGSMTWEEYENKWYPKAGAIRVMTKQQTIDLLKSQLPGFYSAEQVIEMIARIETNSVAPEFVDEVIFAAANAVGRVVRDFNPGDYDYTLEMNGKEVYIESIDLDEDTFADPVADAIRNCFNEKFGEIGA